MRAIRTHAGGGTSAAASTSAAAKAPATAPAASASAADVPPPSPPPLDGAGLTCPTHGLALTQVLDKTTGRYTFYCPQFLVCQHIIDPDASRSNFNQLDPNSVTRDSATGSTVVPDPGTSASQVGPTVGSSSSHEPEEALDYMMFETPPGVELLTAHTPQYVYELLNLPDDRVTSDLETERDYYLVFFFRN